MLRLCTLADIPDNDARGFRSARGEVIVARQGMSVHGYLNSCPHLGIGINFQPNVFMDFTQRYLLCANHGALFRVEDGFCFRGPCQGQSLKKVQLLIENGIIWLTN
ncbi:Rieske 2Fe-2S domain-containing protein [Moraxellaceae bacterium AER2_44_116]|nr:Rieske 2Fe-2S domain-containing protein [Moraxellaceae bacterium]TQC96173.1 Rieske 2Fe-2S domain-containing protein [Moraxellaceae bacterium AER2_44_116]